MQSIIQEITARLSEVTAIEVSPAHDNGEDTYVTTPEEATFWTIYARMSDGTCAALCDHPMMIPLARDLALIFHEIDRPVTLQLDPEPFEMCVTSISELHDEIYDAVVRRNKDCDPLIAFREAIALYAGTSAPALHPSDPAPLHLERTLPVNSNPNPNAGWRVAAIRDRVNGVWSSPNLRLLGAMTPDLRSDINQILNT